MTAEYQRQWSNPAPTAHPASTLTATVPTPALAPLTAELLLEAAVTEAAKIKERRMCGKYLMLAPAQVRERYPGSWIYLGLKPISCTSTLDLK